MSSLFDDLVRALGPLKLKPKPAPKPRPKPCLIIGCEKNQMSDGLCRSHNRDVVERDALLEGMEMP